MIKRNDMIEFIKGNLLSAEAEALVNTVNTVGVMGKGIALQFRETFPENYKFYQKACKQDEVQIGKMLVYDNGQWATPRYIINFPTKRHWRERSKIEDVEAGLFDLQNVIRDYGIKSIAVPPLGCGSGGGGCIPARRLILHPHSQLHPLHRVLFRLRADNIPVQ